MKSIVICAPVLFISSTSLASVSEFEVKSEWQTSVSSYTTITFTELPEDTFVTDQYSQLGLQFTDGTDFIYSINSFLNDGFGLNGGPNTIHIQFSQPITSIAADFPGGLIFVLSNSGNEFYTSSWFQNGFEGIFGGLISTEPFDQVTMFDPGGGVSIDDLYFGPPIPAPSPLLLLSLSPLFPASRRRRPI